MTETIRYKTASVYFVAGRTSMRRYSRVRMARNRGATAELQGTSRERQRSMAARRSRRNATQDGHASICPRIWSQVSGSSLPSRYSERLANRSRHSAGRLPPLEAEPLRFFPMGAPLFECPEVLHRSWFISLDRKSVV